MNFILFALGAAAVVVVGAIALHVIILIVAGIFFGIASIVETVKAWVAPSPNQIRGRELERERKRKHKAYLKHREANEFRREHEWIQKNFPESDREPRNEQGGAADR